MTGRVQTSERGDGHPSPDEAEIPPDHATGGSREHREEMPAPASGPASGPDVAPASAQTSAQALAATSGLSPGSGSVQGVAGGGGRPSRRGRVAAVGLMRRLAPAGRRTGVRRVVGVRHGVAWAIVGPLALWLLVRATGLGAGTAVETFIVFTPYAAVASVVALAVVALLRVRPAALVAAACCIGYGLVLAPLFVAAEGPSPAPTGPVLRVMTSNVQFGWADAATVVDLVEQHDIEVLGVQELTPAFHRRLVAEGIEDVLPHGVVDALGGASGTGLYSRYPVERVGSDVPGAALPGEHAQPTGLVAVPGAPPVQVTVVHPVPPVLAGGVDAWRETLHALPRPGATGGADGRTESAGRAGAEAAAGPLGHGTGSSAGGDAGAAGTRGLGAEGSAAAPHAARDRVHMLIGDFNATVDQPTMRALLDDGYTDAALARGRGWEPTWRPSGIGPMLTIDHVLVDEATAVDDVSVHDVPGSDHRALVATLRLPQG